MGYFNDMSLAYTAEDAELDRRDGLTPTAPFFTCAHCGGGEHVASALQPAFCTECVYAMLQGRGDARKDLRRVPAVPLTCHICGELPTGVTLRVGGETFRICRPCYDAGYQDNERNQAAWEADIDEAALTPAELYRAERDRQRAGLTDSLAAEEAAAAEEVQPF